MTPLVYLVASMTSHNTRGTRYRGTQGGGGGLGGSSSVYILIILQVIIGLGKICTCWRARETWSSACGPNSVVAMAVRNINTSSMTSSTRGESINSHRGVLSKADSVCLLQTHSFFLSSTTPHRCHLVTCTHRHTDTQTPKYQHSEFKLLLSWLQHATTVTQQHRYFPKRSCNLNCILLRNGCTEQ